MHLNDGQLRAYIDGEPGAEIARHLEGCPECQEKLAVIKGRAQRTSQRLAFLAPREDDQAPAAIPALNRFKTRLTEKKETFMFNKLFSRRLRTLWIGVASVVIIVLILSIPQMRVWAGQFLSLFRVQQVSAVSIDASGLSSLSGDSALGKEISQLLSNSVTITKKPADPQTATDQADATSLAGFTVRLPDNQTDTPKLTVRDSMGFKLVVDRAKAQSILDEAGRSDLVLPDSIDGAEITVDVPASVSAAYGTCPDLSSNSDMELNLGSAGRQYGDCIILAEIPSPTVNSTQDIDLEQLAEIALQFTGMSADQAKTFSQNVDWTTSLVLPIPKNAATYKEVQVDGVTGILVQRPVDDAPEYALIWVKDGVIYTIGALGSDSSKAIDMANSMK